MREMVEGDCQMKETAAYYAHKYEAAFEGGRDPEDGIWEERFDDEDEDWHEHELPDNDSRLALVGWEEIEEPQNNLELNSGSWEKYCASDSSSDLV
jgi:hypothetical protein